MGSLRLLRPHHFQQLSKQRQDIGPTIQLSCPSMAFLYPAAGESGPIARAQAVSTPNVLCQPSSGTPDSSFHTTNSPAPPPRAHKLRFFDVRGPEYGPYFSMEVQIGRPTTCFWTPRPGYFGAILSHTTIGDAGAKIFNGITTFMQSVCSQREPEPVTMQQRSCPTPDCDGARPKQSYCLHGAPSSSLHGASRAPT